MAKALPGVSFPRLVSASVMSCMVLLSACGGGPSIQHDSTLPAVASGDLQAGSVFPALAVPAERPRQSSTIPALLQLEGAGFNPALYNNGVSSEGSVAVYSPAPTAGSVQEYACALYEFDLSLLDDPHGSFGLELIPDGPVDGGAVLLAGIADYDSGRWQWVAPQLATDGREILSWSWGMSQSGGSAAAAADSAAPGAVRTHEYLPVAVLVTGADVRLASIAIRDSDSPPAGGSIAFRKGWDGTVKGSTRRVDLEQDAGGAMNVSYYDDSNGQLYHMWQEGRFWTTQAVTCTGDNGLSHDLLSSPDGGMLLAWYEADSLSGAGLLMDPASLAEKKWSPASFRFETGDDGSGALIEAGARPSVAFDDDGFPHIFYECASTGRIRHAWKELGALDWLHEYISPDGSVEGQPLAFNSPYGVCCLTRKGWDGCIYRPSEGTWIATLIPADMHNPLDPESDQAFFDAVCRDSTVVMAMACTGGQRIVRFDLDSETIVQNEVFSDSPGSGCFLDLEVLDDGSVRIAQYNAVDKMIYFETGDIPGAEQFSSVAAVHYGEDEDCDGIAFWVDSAPAAGSPRDALLVDLSYAKPKIKKGESISKKGIRAHITLLK
ncbi:MAG: hypothetical protein R3F46_02390 [bacterium]